MLLFISSSKGWCQLFQNRNLYDIWITAEQYADAGKFNEAIKLYEAAPQVPEFARQLKITRQLQTVFQTGERLYRAKKYAEALEAYSKYREIAPNLHTAILDARIQTCLQQLDKVLVKKIAESTRVVAGFEYAYKGDTKLLELDTLAALGYYNKARQLGGNLNQTLREQYLAGLQSVKALRKWGEDYRRIAVTEDKALTLDILRKYRSASKYIISTLEYEIKSAEEGQRAILGSRSQGNPTERMNQYAQDCRIEDLAYFVKNNSSFIPQAVSTSRLVDEYRAIEGDIARLLKDPGNGPFLESAYRNLIEKAGQIPSVGGTIQLCAKKLYFEYLYGQAVWSEKEGLENGDKTRYQEALRYSMEAYQLGLSELNTDLEVLQRRIAAQLDCEDRRQDFENLLVGIRLDLSQCQVKSAKTRWDTAAARLSGCGLNNSQFSAQYIALRDSVYQFYIADSSLVSLTARGNQALDTRKCEEARGIIEQIQNLWMCDPGNRDSLLLQYRDRISQCEQLTCYITNRNKAIQSAENREWKKSYDYYQQAYTCASETQKLRIKEIMEDMECDAYPDRCQKSNVSVSLEPSVRIGINKPKYTEEGKAWETTYGYLTSAGLQVSFLSYLNPLDVVLGLDYFQTEYQSVDKGDPKGDFKISGADAYVAFKLHPTGTDPNRLRPYLKGGFEVLLPMSYSLQNHYKNESTRDRSLLKKQSLGTLAALGIELQKKKFGFFIEIVGGYNFSGIYNANAVSSSGAKGKTEAQFRTAGIRVGARLW
ncbi:hypothetical protein [Salmonirosea aquatica]|uniref:hypothetical protein n=1 Tax=Salmonirosea aquatica TaxID=2654236 RepID=UPI0035709C61